MRVHNLLLPPVPPQPSSRKMIRLARIGVVENVFCADSFTWSALALSRQIPQAKRSQTYKAIMEWKLYLNDHRIYDSWKEVQDLD